MVHTFVALVEDCPGALNRVASLFRRWGYNLESLTVGRSERPGYSRMALTVDADLRGAERAHAHLLKLTDVDSVERVTHGSAIVRDMALVRASALGAQRLRVHRLADEVGARVVDAAADTMTLEITGDPSHVQTAIERLQGEWVVEVFRTGPVVMGRRDCWSSVSRDRATTSAQRAVSNLL